MHSSECLAIVTDNSNMVAMFNLMCALPFYNPLLIQAVDVLISAQIELCVYHIPGSQNTVANHLLQRKNTHAATLIRGIQISTFILPQIVLGAVKKLCRTSLPRPGRESTLSGHKRNLTGKYPLPSQTLWTQIPVPHTPLCSMPTYPSASATTFPSNPQPRHSPTPQYTCATISSPRLLVHIFLQSSPA